MGESEEDKVRSLLDNDTRQIITDISTPGWLNKQPINELPTHLRNVASAILTLDRNLTVKLLDKFGESEQLRSIFYEVKEE